MKRYLYNVMCGVSVTLNALIGGPAMQTMCARIGVAEHEGKRWAKYVSGAIDMIDKNHCRDARRYWKGRVGL